MKKLIFASVLGVVSSGMVFAADPAYMNMVSTVVDDDYSTFLNGGDSVIGRDITDPMTAGQLLSMYEKNELAANKKLKGKLVRVKSAASEIGEDAVGNAYIKVNGKSAFESVMLYVDGNDERVLSLEKGSKIDFLCRMDKYIMHTPMLKKCSFAKDIADERKKKMESVTNADSPLSKFRIYLETIYSVNKDLISKSCVTTGKECSAAIQKATTSKDNMEKVKNIVSKESEGKNYPPLPF